MVNFTMFYNYLKLAGNSPNPDIFLLEISSIEVTIQFKQLSFYFAIN